MSAAERSGSEDPLEVVVDAGAFDLGDRSARRAALCIHGLTGTPYEVRSLGEALAGAGTRAVGPFLPGHDQTPEALASLVYTDWLDAMRGELAALRSAHDQVFLVGFSLGSLLALALAAEEPVDGVAAIGTPLRFRPVVRYLVPALKYLVPYLKKSQGSDIRDPAARRRHPSFPVMPLASVHAMVPLQERVAEALPRIEAPILVAHGTHDMTANPPDSQVVHDRVSSNRRRLMWFSDSGHILPVDFGGPRLAEAVVEHLHWAEPAGA